jgi:DNA-binding MarR family transcriptional regulator
MSTELRAHARVGPPDGPQAIAQLESRTWLRMLGCVNLVLANLRANLRVQFDVTLPTFDILAQVQRAPTGPTMSELSRRLLVSKGNVTDLVTRLERRGLLERRADGRDARVQHVHLTPAGEKLIRRMLAAHERWLIAMTAQLGQQPMLGLHRSLGALRNVLVKGNNRGRVRGDGAPNGCKPTSTVTKAPSVQR